METGSLHGSVAVVTSASHDLSLATAWRLLRREQAWRSRPEMSRGWERLLASRGRLDVLPWSSPPTSK